MSCSKRGDGTSCTYSTGGANGVDRLGEESRDSEAQLRLQKLEEMVTSLMRTTKEDSEARHNKMSISVANADQHFKNLSATASNLSPETQLNTNVSGRTYVSATHWTAILENVPVPSSWKTSTYS